VSSDVPVENQAKLVEKAEDIEVINPSAMDRAVMASVPLNANIRDDSVVENIAEIVVTFVRSTSFMSTPLGKCTRETLVEVTVLIVAIDAVVQLTITITFSESCGIASAAFTIGIRVGFRLTATRQIAREQSSNSFFIAYLDSCYFLFNNKTLL
jgi:hypothetical protein